MKEIINYLLPNNNIYYEKNSPDGYAFQGLALININEHKKSELFFKIIKDMNYCLNEDIKCNHEIKKNDIILYTQFWCYLLCFKLNKINEYNKIYANLNSINFYDNEYIKYTKNYKNYLCVPNIMPLIAYIELLHNSKKTQKYDKIINKLYDDLDNGNWFYYEKKIIFGLEEKKKI